MGKTQLIKDCRAGLMLRSSTTGYFRKVTRVTNKSLFMGHSELKFPKDPKLIIYDGIELRIKSPDGKTVLLYKCKRPGYWD